MRYIKLFENLNYTTYYHGTSNTEAGLKIINDGFIKPGNTEIKRGNKLTPMIGRSYATPEIEIACIYAIGANMIGSNDISIKDGEIGYVFEVDVNNNEILADEDFIGYAIYLCHASLKGKDFSNYKDKIDMKIINWNKSMKECYLSFAKNNLTTLQYTKCIRYDDYGDFAVAGKKLGKFIPDVYNDLLINSGTPISIKGNIPVIHAYALNKKDNSLLEKDASNFFEISKKLF